MQAGEGLPGAREGSMDTWGGDGVADPRGNGGNRKYERLGGHGEGKTHMK